MKHSEIRFGQIVTKSMDRDEYMVLGTVYQELLRDVLFDLDAMFVVLYKIDKGELFNTQLNPNRVLIAAMANVSLVKESSEIRKKAEVWLLKSRLCVNYLTLNNLDYPEENYKKLVKEKEKLERFETRLEEKCKEVIKQEPVSSSNLRIMSNKIYLMPYNDKQNYYYVFKHKKRWYYMNIMDKNFIMNLNEICLNRLNPCVDLIDTGVKIPIDSDYINKNLREKYADKW